MCAHCSHDEFYGTLSEEIEREWKVFTLIAIIMLNNDWKSAQNDMDIGSRITNWTLWIVCKLFGTIKLLFAWDVAIFQ